jgi:hypothetical protein
VVARAVVRRRPNIVVQLFSEWERVLLDLQEARRRPALDVALRCATHGWIAQAPSGLSSSHAVISALVEFRNPETSQRHITKTFTPRPTAAHQPLIEVAPPSGPTAELAMTTMATPWRGRESLDAAARPRR